MAALLLGLWYWETTRKPGKLSPDFEPFVSIIVPAYNEEKVIGKCLQSLLASTYLRLEIIVVDDGSTDGTAEAVEKFLYSDQIRLVRQTNSGKATAVNVGISHANGEILVIIDADTKFNPDTVVHFVKHFQNQRVGAVSGNAKVGNRVNLLTIWQSIEYIMGFNLSRRMFSLLNCVTVVPGAVGAFRKDVVRKAGYFSSDTIVEDTDITISIRKMGYSIPYEENSIGWTEAPDTLSGLWKQRYRWSYGTLQTLWKHRGALFNPKYGTLGMFGLPLMLIFEAILPLMAPILDLALIYFLLTRGIEAFFAYFSLYAGLEIVMGWVAFSLDKEKKGALMWMVFQRFVYRQMMYLVVIKSVITALKGSRVRWQKLVRRGTVR
jgi:cellulose synthase/poly-beta-1,6-N-acetylglucosamine synthase-like glycosyltransferase